MVKSFNKIISVSAPGKCILFGEHSVVYGHPAISMGISLKSTCTIENIKYNKIQIKLKDFNKFFEFKDVDQLFSKLPRNFNQIHKFFEIITKLVNENIENVKITINSSVLSGSGLGSSASIAVAMMGSINEFYKLNLGRSEISNFAYEIEKAVHGTPSGIDNTTCTYGNLIYFHNKNHHILQTPNNFNILITYSGISHKTRIAIEKIKKLKDEFPELVDQILNNMAKIATDGRELIEKENLPKIGHLMNINQGLLSALGVSNHTISRINEIALENGAYGSKLTGAGLGGCVISIGKDMKRLARILENKGFKNFLIDVDKEGVRVDYTKEN